MSKPQPVRSTGPSLVISTQLVEDFVRKNVEPNPEFRWVVKLFPESLEASIYYRYQVGSPSGDGEDLVVEDADQRAERSRANSARRAKGRLRRYVVANRLDRLATLTYVESHSDPKQVSADIGGFFREVRDSLGKPFPYVWVREWHPGGHGLHVHFLVGRYIHWSVIKEAWGDGRIDIRRKSREPLRLGDGPADEARYLARYLAKYLSKSTDLNRDEWSHRFDVAQGFQPKPVLLSAPNEYEARLLACRYMGHAPSVLWQSRDEKNYTGPAVSWMAWNR